MNFTHDDERVSSVEDPRMLDLTKNKKRKNSSNRRVSNKGFMGEEEDEDALPIGKVLIRRSGKPTKRKAENANTQMEIGSGGLEPQLHGFEQKNPRNRRGMKFCEGDMVWAKVKSHPWWPGQIYNPALATASAKRSRRSGHVLVAFFGDATFGWFVDSNLIPFEPTYMEKSKQTASRSFCEAVEDAVDEVGRRATLGLMCGCRQSFSSRPKEGGYVEFRIPGWDTPVVYPEKVVKEARDGFRSNQMLGFLKRMAVAPWCGEDSAITGIRCAAEARTYRSTIASKDTAAYRKALRLDGKRAEDEAEDGQLPEEGTQEALTGLSVKDQNGRFEMTERKVKCIDKGQASQNEEKYLFKRRNLGSKKQSSAVGVTLMGGIRVIATNQQTTLVGQDENADDISKYVFQKRNQHESGAIHMKEGRKKDHEVHGEQYDLQEAKRRKKEITHHTSNKEKNKCVDKPALKKRWREIEASNKCISNIDPMFPDRIDMKWVPDDSDLIQTVASNAPQNDTTAEVSELLPKNKLKKTLQVGVDSEAAVEIEQSKHSVGDPSYTDQRNRDEVVENDTTDTANTEGNALCARPEEGVPVKPYEFEADGLTGLANVQASLADSTPHLAFDDGTHQGNKDPVDEEIQSVKDNATPMSNRSEVQGMGGPKHVLGKVNEKLLKMYDVVKGQVINLEEKEISIVSKPQYADSYSDILDVEKSSPMAQENLKNICQDSKISTAAGSGSRSKTNIAGVALAFGEEVDFVCRSSQRMLTSDHRVVKKPEGFKTLVAPISSDVTVSVNDEKLSVSAVASKHAVNSSNKGRLFDNQFTGNGHVHEIAEAADDTCRVKHDGNYALHPDRTDEPQDDDRECSACPSVQDSRHNIVLSNVDSGSFLHQLVEDLRSLAIDPFHGSERGCQEIATGVILRFRSLVYQKIQSSLYFQNVSMDVLPSLGIETEEDNKEEKELERPLMSLSSYVDASIRYDSSTLVSSRSSEAAIDATSNVQSVPKLSNHTSQTPDAGSQPKEIKKLKFDAQLDDYLKRSKKRHSSEKSAIKSCSRRVSGMPGGDLREPDKQRKKPSRSYDNHKTPEEPMALCMKFPQGFALPSEVQLKARFVRFGQLDVSGTRVYCQTNCGRVIFKSKSDAEAAYKYAIENSLFGQASVKYKLKQMFPPKKETVTLETCSESLKKANVTLQSKSELPNERKLSEEAPSQMPDIEFNKLKLSVQDEPPKLPDIELRDSWPSASSDGPGFEVLNESVPNEFQSSQLVHLKSCLKKPDESGNINSKEYTRVTFLLDKEHRDDLYDRKNVLSQTDISGDSSPLLSSHSPNISAIGPNPPDISDQMLYLLKKCNEIVGDVRSTMAYVPYYLFSSNM